ncbi:MAG: DUF2249 domain-containing protein [Bacteroidia bacterium]|nr:DUF2249 domain-containing protein [Bacteroidia bacterium]
MEGVLNKNGEFDVRVLIPIKRHELLLKMFTELPVNDSFVFINDHDPIPLYYEFCSIHGNVVGWKYLNKDNREWKVQVTRESESQKRDMSEVSTLLDLRKIDKKEWKQVVFHRYSMMLKEDKMALIADTEPTEIHAIFDEKFKNKHTWEYKKEVPGEFIIHITKKGDSGLGDDGYAVVKSFDIRPYSPADRHEMFYQAFDEIKAGEAFEFINDHDPKPLYYQMKAESKEPFRWEYLAEGPDDWKVRVIKVKE